jgi:1-Cys peroxiredoxin 6
MPFILGDLIPNFTAETSEGPITFHDWIGDSWAILFSHPNDYTPVCTTELGTVAQLVRAGEFSKRNVKPIALSCNSVEDHVGWIKDIVHFAKLPPNEKFPYPIIADPKRELANLFGMLDEVVKDGQGVPLTARAVYVVGPTKKMMLSILYPATTGRNFNEILRVIDSLQLTAKYSVATPANWEHGQKVMVVPTLSDEEALKKFEKGFEKVELPSGKGYVRLTPQPDL